MLGMRMQRRVVAISSSCALAATVVVALGASGHPHSAANAAAPPSSLASASASAEPIVIDQSVGEVFTATTASLALGKAEGAVSIGKLTPDEAAAASANNGGFPIPAEALVQGGSFSMAVGPGHPDIADGTEVYAFSWPNCAPNIAPAQPMDDPTASSQPSSPHCTLWTFVDANSGAVLDMTWSQ